MARLIASLLLATALAGAPQLLGRALMFGLGIASYLGVALERSTI